MDVSETHPGLLTDSFEQVVTTFYDAARDATLGGSSEPCGTLKADLLVIDQTRNSISVQASVLAKNNEFQETMRTPRSEDVDQTSMDVEPTNLVPEVKKTAEHGNRITTVATIHNPPQTSPQPEDAVQLVIPKKPTVASALETTAKKSQRSPPILQDAHMESVPGVIQPQSTSNNLVVLRTHNPCHTIDFEWSLENFSNYNGDLYSSPFPIDCCAKVWQAHIALTTFSATREERMEVFFNILSRFKGLIKGYFDLGVYNTRGEMFGKWVSVADFSENSRENLCFKTTRPAGRKSSDELKLYDDELIIKGRIVLTGCCVSTRAVKEPRLNIGTEFKVAKSV